jgi:tetratricopeptide (TPR) repeat protein
VLISAREFPAAVQALERAVALDPSSSRAWEMLGHARFQSRRFRDAISAYEQAIAYENTPFLWQGIGAAYQELFRPDSAAAAYRQVLRLDSTFAPAWAALSEIAEDDGDLAEALRAAERASIRAPRSVPYQFMRARLLVRLNREREGIPILEEIVQRDSTHYGALYNLGLAYRQTGREDEALDVLEKSARLRDRMTDRKPL